MDRAHDGRLPVVVIQHTNVAPEAVSFRKGTHGWKLHDEIRRRHADIAIEKTLPGSFTGSNLEDWLGERSISTVTIADYMTQMCCDTTARQAFHRNYAVNFLSDATGTMLISNKGGTVSAANLHLAVLVTRQQRLSRVLTTAEWIMEF